MDKSQLKKWITYSQSVNYTTFLVLLLNSKDKRINAYNIAHKINTSTLVKMAHYPCISATVPKREQFLSPFFSSFFCIFILHSDLCICIHFYPIDKWSLAHAEEGLDYTPPQQVSNLVFYAQSTIMVISGRPP